VVGVQDAPRGGERRALAVILSMVGFIIMIHIPRVRHRLSIPLSSMMSWNLFLNMNVINLDESFAIAQKMIYFLYHDDFPAIEDSYEILAAALKYEIPAMVNASAKILFRKVNCENFVDIYKLAKVGNIDCLLNAVRNFMLTNKDEALVSAAWNALCVKNDPILQELARVLS
jgi:hypothetical protein